MINSILFSTTIQTQTLCHRKANFRVSIKIRERDISGISESWANTTNSLEKIHIKDTGINKIIFGKKIVEMFADQ